MKTNVACGVPPVSGAWIHKDEKPWTRQSLSPSRASPSGPLLALPRRAARRTAPSRPGPLACRQAARPRLGPGLPAGPDRSRAEPGPRREPLADSGPTTELDHPVVVGYDGSGSSLHALAYAAGMARRLGRPLLLAYITSPSIFCEPLSGQVIVPVRDSAETHRWLLAELDEVCDREGLDVRIVTRQGSPARELAAAADEFGADALVIGAPASVWHHVAGGARLAGPARALPGHRGALDRGTCAAVCTAGTSPAAWAAIASSTTTDRPCRAQCRAVLSPSAPAPAAATSTFTAWSLRNRNRLTGRPW